MQGGLFVIEREKLALYGGQPVRDCRKDARPVISQEAKEEVMAVLSKGTLAQFYGGTQVRAFESEYAAWFGRSYAVAVSSGTAALHVMYLAARLPERSEVLIPANAYVSVLSALLQAHLIPVIVDLDPQSWAMDPEDCRRKITSRTSAIVAVHMYGQPCPMTELAQIAEAHDLTLLEDCGQSHGALWARRKTGTFGRAAAFSLCCRKHIALGEGGILITDDEELAATARSLAHKGKGEGWFDYREMGFSYNMTEVQAALGRHQLRRLDSELERRQRLARWVQEQVAETGLSFPLVPAGSTHAYFKLNALVPPELAPYRNEIVDALQAENVGCDPSHPHLLDIDWIREQRPYFFRTLPPEERPSYGPEIAPVARDLLRRQIGIEVGPGLDEEDLSYTVAAIRKVMAYFRAAYGATGRKP
ncbi:aminotransferase DegT [Thermogemmatispora aurantia]|uniref:Aminotransferase DegT n=1 Tax=Thermogemmatispora aurantia TaxID=2045279 RepID=A0A5J4K5J6_9CHLR|nr:aminotransferase DegT [Thermogemmatispora aurantia]